MKRNRTLYLLIAAVVVVAGLASRKYAAALPSFVAEYAGDTLWAAMVFVGIGFLAPRWPTPRVMILALAICYGVEISQLYHAPWIDSLRSTRIGGLVLGFGFLWSDLVCYTVGVGLGALIETTKRR
jgi:hypothetical protein